MINRIIVIGKNKDLPRWSVCRNCDGTGHDYGYPINPSERPYKITCPVCNGDGAFERVS